MKGVSVSRKVKRSFLQNGITCLPIILDRSEESGQRLQVLHILTCVRQLCPYRLARLGTSLRIRGKLTTKEERIHNFKKYYLIVAVKQ